jgi:pimeloyl-ACP methyl ester carboxylesterase
MNPVERAALDGVELEYELAGEGDPVVLVHAGVCAEWFVPLLAQPALRDRFRVLSYHRAGYAGSSRPTGELTIADNAGHCHALMRHVGIERAHLVGHSSSAMMALQLALDRPEAVGTLALLEAARPAGQNEQEQEFVRTVAAPALELFGAGDHAGAVDAWMRGVCAPDYRTAFDAAIPGAFDRAIADAPTFFAQELPAVRAWSFTEEDARRVTQPVLAVLGAESRSTFRERRQLLLDWLPDVEPYDLPGANHLLHVQNPDGAAEALAAFFARHPL